MMKIMVQYMYVDNDENNIGLLIKSINKAAYTSAHRANSWIMYTNVYM